MVFNEIFIKIYHDNINLNTIQFRNVLIIKIKKFESLRYNILIKYHSENGQVTKILKQL